VSKSLIYEGTAQEETHVEKEMYQNPSQRADQRGNGALGGLAKSTRNSFGTSESPLVNGFLIA
jgi:hypothetical protein